MLHKAVKRGTPNKLYKTGVKPQQLYGASIVGVSPSQQKAARRAAILSSARAGVCPCPTTLLAWAQGPLGDPNVSIPTDQVRLWVSLWNSLPVSSHPPTRAAWRTARQRASDAGKQKWQTAAGPISATICTLLDFGWDPVQADVWLSPDRKQTARSGHLLRTGEGPSNQSREPGCWSTTSH